MDETEELGSFLNSTPEPLESTPETFPAESSTATPDGPPAPLPNGPFTVSEFADILRSRRPNGHPPGARTKFNPRK